MAKFQNSMTLALHEKVKKLGSGKKEFKEVARVKIPFPTLQDFGLPNAKLAIAEADGDGIKKGEPVYEDGVPVYADPVHDWLQQAIVSKVAATARNRFKGGVLKQGATLAEDFETLTAETARTGEALALRRDAKASFEAYLQSKNKKAQTVQLLGELFWNSSKVLASAGEKYIEGLAVNVSGWLDSLTDDKKARFAPKILELQESINNAQEGTTVDDDDLAA